MPCLPDRQTAPWRLRTRALSLDRPRLMGIVNATPDSFSDGGRFLTVDQGVAHALRLLDDGADILDIGGESTRPGAPAATAEAISGEEEQRRVVPLIEAVLRARPDAILSVDTYRAATAEAAVAAGAEIVNDVSGMVWDERMAATCAVLGCGVVVMHTRGLPSAWQTQPPLSPGEVVPLVLRELRARVIAMTGAGVQRDRIAIDPGFGFGKRGTENHDLLDGMNALCDLGLPLLAGLSRKGFLGGDVPAERDAATHAAGLVAVNAGARIVRVHDVKGAHDALVRAALL